MPQLFGIPRAAVAHLRAVLVADSPAAVAAFDNVHQPGLVAGIAVVVACEQVAIFIKRQLLRISQASRVNLQVGTVRLAAENRSRIGKSKGFTFSRFHVEATVADAEIEPAVRS